MLTITKQSDYGMLFLSYLSDKKRFVPLTEIVRETKLPQRFLARIAAVLAKNKYVISREGKVGGYKLTKDIRKLNLFDYLKIFEKDVALAKCINKAYKCPYIDNCSQYKFFQHKLNTVVVSQLKKVSLHKLFNG